VAVSFNLKLAALGKGIRIIQLSFTEEIYALKGYGRFQTRLNPGNLPLRKCGTDGGVWVRS
jgi:hypothetical protein